MDSVRSGGGRCFGVEDDGAAEPFELGDESAGVGLAAGALVEPGRSEDVVGLVKGQQVSHDQGVVVIEPSRQRLARLGDLAP